MKYPADHLLGIQRNGVNHVSMNMGSFDRNAGPVRGTNYPVYPDALLNWYQTKQVASVRLMFTWEAVQSALGGPIPPAGARFADYWSDLTNLVGRFLARGITVILAPWQYNTASGDTDVVYRDAPFTAANFAQFWGPFATAINAVTGNDQRVGLDLMNEPHTHAESDNKPGDIGISLVDWFARAQAAITAIRATGATNTIYVPGMAYTAASSFVANGSAAAWLALTDPLRNSAVTVHCYAGIGSPSPTVLRDACNGIVTWARSNGRKVHIGEIAINAGPNGRPTVCSSLAVAQAQWTDWTHFCLNNADTLIGWNWWGNSTAGWWNQGDSCDPPPSGSHWGLTLDDGTSSTVYMNLIESTIPAPHLILRDNFSDTGHGVNTTTPYAWESPDIWVTQPAIGGTVGDPILGGQPSVVSVRVTNTGKAGYPAIGNAVLRVYWAKGQSGLSWPAPWNGAIPLRGGAITTSYSVGAIPIGQSKIVPIPWPNTPNPADYPGNDGHFCLLAFIAQLGSPDFDGFQGPDLNANVLRFSDVAWRNIHIDSMVAERRLGEIIIANPTERAMIAQISIEVLNDAGDPGDPTSGRLLLSPRGDAAREVVRGLPDRSSILEDLGQETYQLLDLARGIPELVLQPGDEIPLGLAWVTDQDVVGYAIRVIQIAHDGEIQGIVGGQTFVAGAVTGFTT